MKIVKKILIDYYALIMLILFIIYNVFLRNLMISGILYKLVVFILILVNIFILVKYRDRIKYKSFIIIAYFILSLIIAKSMMQYLFGFVSMLVLILTGISKSKMIKVITTIMVISFIFVYKLYFLILAFNLGLINDDEDYMTNRIYEDTHYSCNKGYEVYAYSNGAFDSYHYSVAKNYVILKIGKVINIVYMKSDDITYEEYQRYIKNNNCQ